MESNVTEIVTNLVLQMGVIIFAARLGGNLAKKAGISSVLGELIAGIIIGPFALGSLPLPGFPSGFFPVYSESLAVTPELYSFSMVASIILLFASGLETDLTLFLRYSVAGGIIGIGGVAFSFVLGDLAAMALFQTHFMDTRCLFLGIMSTATSVGITARILSDKREMDSPEGVTILASAVFDDVLGIILLALELFVIPGFGIAGILGLVCFFGGLLLALLNNADFDFFWVSTDSITDGLLVILGGLLGAVLLSLYLMRRIGRRGLFYRVALHAEQNIEDGYVAVSGRLAAMVGREGRAVTVMRPSGKVRIDGEDYDAISYHNTYLDEGTPIKVVKVENMQLYVVPQNLEEK